MATNRARRVFASAERKEALDAELELRTAEDVAATLGNMKGALMKLGQIASFVDDGMPEPVRQALEQLQADAPPMSAELAAEVVEQELRRAARDSCSPNGIPCRSRPRRSARCTAPSPTTVAPSP